MKVLFIDHEFHKRTKSSNFFIASLQNEFDVDRFYFDPEYPDMSRLEKLETAAYDLIIIWQLDMLGTYFLTFNKPVVIIPMYDGSSAYPDEHWLLLKGAYFINFSKTLYYKHKKLGLHAMCLTYYPKPHSFDENKDRANCTDTRPSVFFWMRRPDQISIKTVSQLFPPEAVKALHVHLAYDMDYQLTKQDESMLANYSNVTRSNWFDTKVDYIDAVSRHDVYIAPRYAEGIGLSFLEAMALGRCVVAADYPTHNEYLSNKVTGTLFNCHEPLRIPHSAEMANQIGRRAFKACEIGQKKFKNQLHDTMQALSDHAEGKNEDLRRSRLSRKDSLQLVKRYFDHGEARDQALRMAMKIVDGDTTNGKNDGSLFAEANRLYRTHKYDKALQLYKRLMNAKSAPLSIYKDNYKSCLRKLRQLE